MNALGTQRGNGVRTGGSSNTDLIELLEEWPLSWADNGVDVQMG